jgi:osmotically inducible protein OsmC
MPTRTATTTWTGGLQDGTGTVELASSGAGSYEVSFPKRVADEAGGVTSPEELIGAAHSACYAMSLSNQLGQAGASNIRLDVRADVTVGADKDGGGLRIRTVRLTVRGSADGVDEATFRKAADEAKVGCPVSKALAGTDIQLEAQMDAAPA